MNYDLIHAIEPPQPGGRALVTGWPHRLTDPIIQDLARAVGGTVFVVQHLIWAPVDLAEALGIEGDFPADIEGAHNQFSLVFSAAAGAETASQLATRLMAVHNYLAPGGWVMFDAPKEILLTHATVWAQRLYQMFQEVRATDNAHGKLTVTGYKRGNRRIEDAQVVSIRQFLTFAKNDTFPNNVPPFRITLPAPPTHSARLYFRARVVDLDALAARAAALPWDTRKIANDLFGWRRPPVFPAMALRKRLYGALMASGVLGAMRLTSPTTGHVCIVRGDSRRVERERTQQDTRQQIGAFESRIAVLDIETSDLVTYNPQKVGQVRTFLEEWAEPLAEKLQDAFPVAYDPIQTPYPQALKPELVKVIDRKFFGRSVANLSADDAPSLTVTQRHVTAALLIKALGRRAVNPTAPQYPTLSERGNHAVVLSGDPGSGKTFASIRFLEGLTREYAGRHHLSITQPGGWPLSAVITPPANVPGFEKSFAIAAPLFATRVVYRIDDLYRALREARTSPVPLALIIPRTRLRQSQGITAIYDLDTPPFRSENGYLKPNILCPSCGASVNVLVRTRDPERLPQAIQAALTNPVTLRGVNCHQCGSALWQETANGELYALAKALKVFARKLDLDLLGLVLDEVHEDGAPDSKQGQAMAWLVDSFSKVLGMSGTFYGGMASSNFQIFFRLFKWFRTHWGLEDRSAFVSRYGNWRRTWQETGSPQEGWGARVELPGVSPELISNYLINDLVYMSLQEAGFDLVPRQDLPVLVDPTPEEQLGLDQLMADIKARVETDGSAHEKKVSVSGAHLAKLRVLPCGFHLERFAQYSPAFRCDRCGEPQLRCQHTWPVPEDELLDQPEGNPDARPVLNPNFIAAKEQALLSLVGREKSEGRPCLIYVHHSGKYALDERLTAVLSARSIRTLNAAKIRPDRLEREINLAVGTGTDAVVVNPRRVGTGLNLIGTPTVIFYQPIWSVLTTLQGAARSHRPTQTQPVRVYYLVLRGTVEEVILGRVIERMAAIFLASGGDSAGMAAVFDAVGHEETLTELLVSFVSRRVRYDLASVFEELNHSHSAAQDRPPQLPRLEEDYHPEDLDALPSAAVSQAVQGTLF